MKHLVTRGNDKRLVDGRKEKDGRWSASGRSFKGADGFEGE